MFVVAVRWTEPGVLWAVAPWAFHFARRTYESLFVHRYGGRPVPPADYLIEYVYYWGAAIWIARSLGSGWQPPSGLQAALGLAVFAIGEAGNTWAHRRLRNLRSAAGSTERPIPRGGAFEWVSCPHYACEVLSWLGFALLVRVTGAWVFLVAGAGIVSSYALARHRAYRERFDGREGRELYPPGRRAIFPFVL
ncbi:MAG TPA: hypothetical protein VLC09_08725 [Polyangiaceae bacterium]|nr:hypothetical protein [Polyangiaceae bacterium]